MLCYALLSGPSRRRLAADAWLAHFDWILLDPADDTGCPGAALVVVESGLADARWRRALAGLPCRCWCFDGADGWDWPATVEVFRTAFDPEVLGDRLMAWLWVDRHADPTCFAGHAMVLTNGRLSFRTVAPSRYLLQMTVSPTAEIGGDVALYLESPGRALVVLADAIGHGADAALDAALFVLGAMRELAPGVLAAAPLARLCRFLAGRIAVGRFVAAACIDFDLAAGRVRLVNAGMPDILCLDAGGALQRFPASLPPLGLGICPGAEVHELALVPDSLWVLCSDGVDGEALRRTLSRLPTCLSPGDDCGVLACPLCKSVQTDDDASQIIVRIPAAQ